MIDRIEAWLRMRDTARFVRDAEAAAASVRGISTAAATSTGKLGAALQRIGVAGHKMQSTGRTLRHHVTTPLLAIGGASVYAAAKFDNAMEMIHTQSGATQREVNRLKEPVLALAKIRPQGPTELADALYRLEGAGLRGSKALRALKASSDLAMVGNAGVEDTAKTLIQTYYTGIKGVGSFHHLVGLLNSTIGTGDLRLQQLVDALGTGVVPTAKLAGLRLQDVTAAMAVFGDETSNVSGFMAQFATALHFLYNPGIKASKALKELHLGSKRLGIEMTKPHGLQRALGTLKQRLEALPGGMKGIKARQVLGDIFPGGRGRVMLILLNQLDRLGQKWDAQRKGVNKFGEAIHKAGEQPLQRLKTAWSSVQVAAVRFGHALIPAVVPIVEKLTSLVGKLADGFSALPPHTRTVILVLAGLAAAAGPVLVAIGLMASGIGAIGTALTFLAANPIVLIIGALVAVGVGLVVLYKKSETFRNAVNGVFNAVKSVVVGVVHAVVAVLKWWWHTTKNVAHWIAGAVKYVVSVLLGLPVVGSSIRKVAGFFRAMWIVFRSVVGWIGGKVGKLIGFFSKLPGKIGTAVSGIWEPLKAGLTDVLNWIIRRINDLVSVINDTVGRLPGVGNIGPVGQIRKDATARTQANTQAYQGYKGIPTVPRKHRKAQGGTFSDWAMVGEAGPELARHTPSYTEIRPLAKAKRSPAGLGGLGIHVEVPVIMRGREIVRVTADEKADWDVRKGRKVTH